VLLQLEEIQAVHVCTFNQAHRGPTVEALQAGKHVLVEKPMAATLADATEMVRAARQTGKLLMCALKTRYSDDVIVAKRIIDNGGLGDIYYAETVDNRRRGIPGRTFVRQETAGLGAVADVGVYSLDTALYLMGHPRPVSVSGITTNVIGKTHAPAIGSLWPWNSEELEVEEFGAAWIRFGKDSRGAGEQRSRGEITQSVSPLHPRTPAPLHRLMSFRRPSPPQMRRCSAGRWRPFTRLSAPAAHHPSIRRGCC
jgi:predicted dehydrogenase